MEYKTFNKKARDYFDNVYAIHWKDSSIQHIEEVIKYLRSKGFYVQFSTPNTAVSDNVNYSFIRSYFDGREEDFAILEITNSELNFNWFLENETNISLWFNDSGDTILNEYKFLLIKILMKDIAVNFKRNIYFVNEGEAEYRYRIFKITTTGKEVVYNLDSESEYVEKIV